MHFILVTEQVTGNLGIPEQQSYIQKTQELEAYQMQQKQTYVEIDQTVREKPYFKTQLIQKLELNEGKTAHFEARLEPSGDSTMRTEWMKDGKPLEASKLLEKLSDILRNTSLKDILGHFLSVLLSYFIII